MNNLNVLKYKKCKETKRKKNRSTDDDDDAARLVGGSNSELMLLFDTTVNAVGKMQGARGTE
jgi:hypothetical protein